MGVEAIHDEKVIPTFEFSRELLVSKQRSDEWKAMSNKVREACENYGCFMLLGKELDMLIPGNLGEEMVTAMKSLFDLPEEIKQKHKSPKVFRAYQGKSSYSPFGESFGIDSAHHHDVAESFANLMWPQGNPAFCETTKTVSLKLMELYYTLMEMIFESFGIEKQYKAHEENTICSFRLMKYSVPTSSSANSPSSAEVVLAPHSDRAFLTLVYQVNQVQGLEVLTKQGDWAQVFVPKGAVAVFAGDSLKAWSNGRLNTMIHRVMMMNSNTTSGDNKLEDRYSCALGGLPDEQLMIQPPTELIDNEHPLLYRPFNIAGYFNYMISNIDKISLSDDLLKAYAGLENVPS